LLRPRPLVVLRPRGELRSHPVTNFRLAEATHRSALLQGQAVRANSWALAIPRSVDRTRCDIEEFWGKLSDPFIHLFLLLFSNQLLTLSIQHVERPDSVQLLALKLIDVET
jgi:hypothetical protein